MRIGPYDVIAEIGRGAVGVVLRARAPDGGDRAVKVLKDATGERLPRFERERRLLASLGEADGFVPLLDTGSSAQGPYIVMPFLAGGTLRSKLDRGPLSIAEAEKLARELSSAMGRAHALGIVHRDLKPENVLFSADGRALVADLGLAKHFDRDRPGGVDSVSLSKEGWLRGTAGYMAPEQIADSKSAGPPADVYAIGAILWECLAGEHLIVSSDPRELLARTLAGKHDPIARRRKDVPKALANAIDRALRRDPAFRWPDGAALLRALGEKEAPRSRALLVVLALAALVLGLVLGLVLALKTPPPSPSPPPLVPEATPADRLLAQAASELERCEDDLALADCNKAVVAAPTLPRAWVARAEVKNWKGDYRGAIQDADHALLLAPGFSLAFAHRGEAKSLLGQLDEARKDLDRAVELDPRSPLALTNRAGVREWKTEFDATVADLTRAIELDPKLAKAYGWRAAVHIDHGDLAIAIADSDKAISLAPRRYPSFWSWRASARGFKGDHAGALADLDEAFLLTKEPDVTLYTNRANERFQTRNWKGAVEDATKAIELDPKNARAYSTRGQSYMRLGKKDLASKDIERYVELAPDDRDAKTLKALGDQLR